MRRLLLPLTVLLALVAAACGDDDDTAATTTTTTEPTTTETTATTTTTTAPPAAGTPEQVVAVRADGTVAVLDATDGSEVRTLLEGVAIEPAKNDVAVSPDGRTAYVVRPGGEEPVTASEIIAVATGGGEPQVVATGLAPAISPDGSRLAYVSLEEQEGEVTPVPVLVLHDLASGDERVLRRSTEPPFTFIADTAWTDDGTVLFVAGEIQTGLYAVDADAESLDAARRLGPTARGEGTSWTAVTGFGEDRAAVVETCCDVGSKERWLILAVHVPTGEVEGGFLPGDRTEATRVDADAGDDGLVIVLQGGPEGGTLQRWEDGGDPTTIADGVVAAAW